MERIQRGFELLKKDIYALRYAVLAIGLYYLAMQILFGQFCPLMIALHIPCPGCGMTRALFLVLSGKWGQAWRLQPFVFGWIGLGGCFVVCRYLFDKPSRVLKGYLVLLLLGTLVLYAWRVGHGFPVELRP